MSVGKRLKEERERLGFSQPAFAGLAGASKGAQQNWEKDAASPNALALIAFAEAGADVLYILTGRRTNSGPNLSLTQVDDTVAKARLALLNPHRHAQPGESPDQTEERVIQHEIELLSLVLAHKDALGQPDLMEEAKSLLDIAVDRGKLIAFRAADHAQLRSKRKQLKAHITSYVELLDAQPGDEAINLMAAIALEHNVPINKLVELAVELLADGANQTQSS